MNSMRRVMMIGVWIGLLGLCVPVLAQDGGQMPVMKTNPEVAKGEKEVRIEDRRLRFVVREDWKVQAQEGVYAFRTEDQKMLMMLFTLDKPEEVAQTMLDMDKLIPVQNARFSNPRNGLHNGIPTEVLFGKGVMMPTEVPVELATVTMDVGGKPALAVFYVHKSAFDTHLPHVKRTIESFSLILTRDEAKKLQEKLKKGAKPGPSKKP